MDIRIRIFSDTNTDTDIFFDGYDMKFGIGYG
jgi:hypothetical protein